MTDRLNGVTITFEKDIRDDDAEAILDAMKMIRGVAHVEPNIVTIDDWMSRRQVKSDIRDKLYDFINKEL